MPDSSPTGAPANDSPFGMTCSPSTRTCSAEAGSRAGPDPRAGPDDHDPGRRRPGPRTRRHEQVPARRRPRTRGHPSRPPARWPARRRAGGVRGGSPLTFIQPETHQPDHPDAAADVCPTRPRRLPDVYRPPRLRSRVHARPGDSICRRNLHRVGVGHACHGVPGNGTARTACRLRGTTGHGPERCRCPPKSQRARSGAPRHPGAHVPEQAAPEETRRPGEAAERADGSSRCSRARVRARRPWRSAGCRGLYRVRNPVGAVRHGGAEPASIRRHLPRPTGRDRVHLRRDLADLPRHPRGAVAGAVVRGGSTRHRGGIVAILWPGPTLLVLAVFVACTSSSAGSPASSRASWGTGGGCGGRWSSSAPWRSCWRLGDQLARP